MLRFHSSYRPYRFFYRGLTPRSDIDNKLSAFSKMSLSVLWVYSPRFFNLFFTFSKKIIPCDLCATALC